MLAAAAMVVICISIGVGIAIYSQSDEEYTFENEYELNMVEYNTTTPPGNLTRTIIFIHKVKLLDSDIFVRGGHDNSNGCDGEPAESDSCSIPFTINTIGDTPNFNKYNNWMIGDDFFDWYGEELGQNEFNGIPASGTNLAWTTNNTEVDGHHPLNTYGDNYWMVDFDMDCSLTDYGWISLRGYWANADVLTGWEIEINQGICQGLGGIPVPFKSKNHMARCGYINVFSWNDGACTMDEIPDVTETTDAMTTDNTESPDHGRTIILLHKVQLLHEYVFIRGGIDNNTCSGETAETDTCSIPMFINVIGSSTHYDSYNDWLIGDDFLDWWGGEEGQGFHNGIPASGFALVWTTNSSDVDGYQDINVYGDDYWMIDFEMDCSLTNDGWFEFKGWLANADIFTGWELDINQGDCSGTAGLPVPHYSKFHMARCGYLNLFSWNSGTCQMEPIPDEKSTTDIGSTNYSTFDSTSEEPTTSSPGMKTVIFFHKKVYGDLQYVFIRGGLDEESNPACTGAPAETDPCALPFVIDSLGETPHYERFNDWRAGDDYFDWFGEELGQGNHDGEVASGTPMALTTNHPGNEGYQDLNIYGEDYWMIQFNMDCNFTDSGWFEMKGWLANAEGYTGWELDINQLPCTGSGAGTPPHRSNNHIVRCGYINVIEWNEGSCIIETWENE